MPSGGGEIRLGVVGERGAGKTALLSSFVGFGRRASAPLDLVADPSDDRSEVPFLLHAYARLEHHQQWPERASDLKDADDFQFNVSFGRARKSPILSLQWSDYPGEYLWERGRHSTKQLLSKDSEARAAFEAMDRVCRSDVALLLIDGERLMERGDAYVRELVDTVHSGFRWYWNDAAPALGLTPHAPATWIIGLSKADLLGPAYTARSFSMAVTAAAGPALSAFGREFGPSSIGKRFIRLSAAEQQEGVPDPEKTIGLDWLLPLVLWATAEQWAKAVADLQSAEPPLMFWLRRLFDKELGKKHEEMSVFPMYQAVGRLNWHFRTDYRDLVARAAGTRDPVEKWISSPRMLDAALLRVAQVLDSGHDQDYVLDVAAGGVR